jgi:hypothetical protein
LRVKTEKLFSSRPVFFFTVIIYNADHFFSVLPYLLEWKMISNVRQPHAKKHTSTEKVVYELISYSYYRPVKENKD